MKIRIFLQKTFLPNVAHGNMSTMWSMSTMCPVVAFAGSVAACGLRGSFTSALNDFKYK